MTRLPAALLLAAFALLATAAPAAAHTELIASTPTDGATLPVAPQQIRLTFNGPVRAGFSTVTVTGPDGSVWTVGEPTNTNTVLTVPVQPAGPAGLYTIGYRILSGDGHPVTGTVRFTLTTPANPAAPPAALPGATSPPAPNAHPLAAHAATGTTDGSGVPVWVWLAAALGLLGIGLVIALRMGRSPDTGEGS